MTLLATSSDFEFYYYRGKLIFLPHPLDTYRDEYKESIAYTAEGGSVDTGFGVETEKYNEILDYTEADLLAYALEADRENIVVDGDAWGNLAKCAEEEEFRWEVFPDRFEPHHIEMFEDAYEAFLKAQTYHVYTNTRTMALLKFAVPTLSDAQLLKLSEVSNTSRSEIQSAMRSEFSVV